MSIALFEDDFQLLIVRNGELQHDLRKDMEPTLTLIGRKFYSDDVHTVTVVSLLVARGILKLMFCSKIGLLS